MTFHALALFASVLTLLLGVGWLAAGTLLLSRWRIAASDAALLLGRRIGALYLGLSLICFLSRDVPDSPARDALCAGALLVCALLACLGVFEHRGKRAGPAILVSVALEVVLAVGFGATLLGR